MTASPESPTHASRFRDALETTLRIVLVLALLVWCFQIVRPFVTPVLWGVIIVIAVAPAYRRLAALLGGRRKTAAAVLVLLGLALFAAPAVNISGTLVDSLQELAGRFRSGDLRIPAPPPQIAEWPLIGERLTAFWNLAATNLEAALLQCHAAGDEIRIDSELHGEKAA
jgi:predicted PurR-regulated permease PerM